MELQKTRVGEGLLLLANNNTDKWKHYASAWRKDLDLRGLRDANTRLCEDLPIADRGNLALPHVVSAFGMAACGSTLCIALLIGLSALGQEPTTSPDGVNSHPSQATRDEGESSSQLQVVEKPSASAHDLNLTTGPDGKLSQDQMQQLLRVVADKDIENDKRQRDYTYVERQVQHNLDSKGKIKSTEIKTYEVLEFYGEPIT